MSHGARVYSLVLCFVVLVLLPTPAAAQTADARPDPLPPEMMPAAGHPDADARVFPPLGRSFYAPPHAAEPPPTTRYSDPPVGDWARLAYWSYTDGNYELFTMNSPWRDRGVFRQTRSDADEAQPAISPDGSRIAYVSNADGDFEAGWGAWQASGSLTPTLTADPTAAHSGAGAAALAERTPLFGEPRELTHTANVSEHNARVIIDGDGDAFVIWLTGNPGDPSGLYSATRHADGSWTTTRLLRGGVRRFDVARDADGALHLAATTGDVYLWHQAGDGWSATAEQLPGAAEAWLVGLTAGPGGRLDVLWAKHAQNLYHNRRAGGVWSAATPLSDPQATLWAGFRTATTPDGAFHVIWDESLPDVAAIRYRRLGPNGVWGAADTLTQNDLGLSDMGLAVDAAGCLHVGWLTQRENTSSDLYHRSRCDAGWGAVETMWHRDEGDGYLQGWGVSPAGVTQALVEHSDGYDYVRRERDGQTVTEPLSGNTKNAPSMILGPAGTPHVAFTALAETGWRNFFYTTRSEAGQWSEPINVSGSIGVGYGASLTADDTGNIHALWYFHSLTAPGYDQWVDLAYAGPVPTTTGGESILSRVITVPDDMAHPALSFVYSSGGALDVSVAPVGTGPAGISATLPATTAGMRHHWLDLSAYTGDSLTLTFRLTRVPNRPANWAVIDDVTLGAAHTDIDVTGQSTSGAPGATAVHTLWVTNRSALAAAGVVLTYELPPELVFVSADPAPDGTEPLRWQLGVLPAGGAPVMIRVTTAIMTGRMPPQVVSRAGLTTTDAELEVVNNAADVATTIEASLALPIILRAECRFDDGTCE